MTGPSSPVVFVLSGGGSLDAIQVCTLEHPPGTPLTMAVHALSLLTDSRLISEIEIHRGGPAKPIVLPPPCPSR